MNETHVRNNSSVSEFQSQSAASEQYDVEVFYDGDCPLCLKEIQMLQWFDQRRHRIRFTDISVRDFQAADVGKSMDTLMAEIHGRLPSGEWIVGVEVFRRLYSAIGFSWLVAPTRLPVVSHAADWMYQRFARNRLWLTGRCNSGNCSLSNSDSGSCDTGIGELDKSTGPAQHH